VVGAWFLLTHNIAQRAADFRRRINETYSKAISQLASDKLEERLGGIYTLENISKESPDDYWTVMETLTAFVRERSKRNYAEFKKSDERISLVAHTLWEEQGKPEGKHDENWAEAIRLGEFPATDITAVLTVIKRRSERSRECERTNGWYLDLSLAALQSANLVDAHLEGAHLEGAHLEEAILWAAHLERTILEDTHLEGAHLGWSADLKGAHLEGAHLEGADLEFAHLEEAILEDAHLKGAYLGFAHLKGAYLGRVNLEGADLRAAHLEGADLLGANLKGADLTNADLSDAKLDGQTQLDQACGKPKRLPEGLKLDKPCPPPEAPSAQPLPPIP
jgi:uncharacterized protein YjbI with pentapeptide repeats